MDNNLNFDGDSNFGLGISAFNIKIYNSDVGPNPRVVSLFDATGLNEELVGTGLGVEKISSFNTSGSSVSADSLGLTTFSFPIKINGLIYSVEGGDVRAQLDGALIDITRCAIDGSIKRKGDIQPNFLRRNWFFQDNLIVITGDVLFDQNTALFLAINPLTTIDIVFFVESIG